MVTLEAYRTGHIRSAVEAIRKRRPSYARMLDFYEQVFTVQAAAVARIQIGPVEIAPDLLRTKISEKLPLISLGDFHIDAAGSAETLERLCGIAEAVDSDMASAARILLKALSENRLDPLALFNAVLEEDDAALSRISESTGIRREILAFIGYSSIHPSVVVCAEQLAAYLNHEDNHDEGYCPVCGSPPVLAILQDDGKRLMVCSFCWQHWPVSRVLCPFCHSRDSKDLDYFYAEQEAGYRVDVCNHCRRYMKTLDLRQLTHPLFLPLEQVTTLHFDMLARDKGLVGDPAVERSVSADG